MSALVSPLEVASQRSTGLQQAMILASLKPASSGAYLQQLVVRLTEDITAAVFLRAAEACITRHAGLMARFEFEGSELYQSRSDAAPPVGREIDLRSMREPADDLVRQFLTQDRALPLPLLENEPPWRSTYLSLGRKESAWIWTHHHALCDANSYPPLLVEIFQAYDALRETGVVGSETASPDFLDYLSWRSAQDWKSQKEIWRSRLSRADVPTPLPELRFAYGAQSKSHRCRVDIPLELDQALRSLAEGRGLTLNSLVISACALWLARMQGETRVVFAAMRAARKSSIEGADQIIGPLVNTLPLRIDVPDNLPLHEWLRSVQQGWTELREIEHCSLAQIAEWTGFGHAGLEFPLVLNFQRTGLPEQLHARGLPSHRCNVQLVQENDVPLMLEGFEFPHLDLELIGRPGSVSEGTIRSAAAGMGAALRAFTRGQKLSLGKIELLTSHDHEILRQATRGPSLDVPPGPAHELIECQIRQQPEAIAIQEPGRQLTFREFGEISERIATNIVDLGGTREIVAVLLPPSSQVLCAMLGSLRAGAPFLLINPELPAEERAALLGRLDVAIAIVAPEVAEETRALIGRVFTFADISESPLVRQERPALPKIEPHDLAYLVHTSGSTGEKKFVEIEHRSLAETLTAIVRLYQYRPGDRRLAMGSPGNDYFIGEILIALSGGVTMVFPQRGGALSISDYLAELQREKISVSGIPAAYWHEWVRAMNEKGPVEIPSSLRLVPCSMEKANPQLLAKWRRLVGARVRWLNVYGPAEATVAVTAWDSADWRGDPGSNVPIGRPFGNSEMYVLDERRRRIPVGACGEIAIAGPVVARGYRGLDEATRQKFIANPFATSPEFSRLYLTGDYGFLNEHGEFVFLERRDRQVKIRGYRVELGEIDVILEEYEHIRHAVVTLEGNEDRPRLVAHIVPTGPFDERRAFEWMRTRLPAHMRPMEFVHLSEMPLMPTGKVDRVRLSAAYRARPAGERPRTDAENEEEAKLLSLWGELLGTHVAISRTESFFDLGGNSLLAVRFLARLQNDFGIRLSIHDLFLNSTIKALAPLIRGTSPQKTFTSLTPLNSGGPGKTLFIVHGWAGGVFHTLDFARRLNGVRPVVGLQAVELAGQERHETFEEMASHYADEILKAQPLGPYELLGHSLGGMLAYATAFELTRRGRKVERLYVVDTTPFNLPRWVHVRHVAAQLRPTILPHVKTFLRTWPRYWPRFLRARRRSLKARMRKWPAAKSPGQKPLRPDADHYLRVFTQYVPQRASFDIRLFTPDHSRSTDTYWKYLTRGRVKKFPIHCGHIDMFTPEYLDNLMSAFEQASAPDSVSST